MRNKSIAFLILAAITFAACGGQNEPTNDANGALKGKFSISADKQIRFSQGNLQYRASDKLWRFADSQLETIGEGNKNISDTYDGFIDLFGWGTGNNPTNTQTDKTYYNLFTDWGVNPISNGGNHANLWRTLSNDEWLYILHGRTGAEALLAQATVNGTRGLILLPDDFQLPKGVSFYPVTEKGLAWDEKTEEYSTHDGVNHFTDNIYTPDEWQKLEASGAVFLPLTGGRYGTGVGSSDDNGGLYWTSTPAEGMGAYYLAIVNNYIDMQEIERFFGYCVRLVQDVK